MSNDYKIDEVLIDGGLVNIGEEAPTVEQEEAPTVEQEESPTARRGWFGGKGRKKKKEKAVVEDEEKDEVKDILEDLQLGIEEEEKENLKLDAELDVEEEDVRNDVEKVVKMDVEEDVEKDVEIDVEKDVESETKDSAEEKSGEEVEVLETESSGNFLSKTFSNLGEKLLNVCTFGIFSSTITPTDDPGSTSEKVAQISTASIPGSRTIDPEMGDSERNTYADNDRGLLMSSSSIHSSASSTARNMSLLVTKQRSEKVFCYVAGIVVFVAMAVLFVFGGIFLRRNGW